MRREPTPAERKLWSALRNWQVDGLKFRRQVPIGPYIADFFCPTARLIVEVDGDTHGKPNHDLRRDRWMHAQGLRVLRVWNNEVLSTLDGVLQHIRDAVRTAPLPPTPSRKGRGSKAAELAPSPCGRGLGEGS
ncbi:MAG: endonuclease domain-containing protein [Alphaproteobacteria bacterium]|nr:endonuclease domain-containing protein [Alphaproteobacteria bacterium]